MAILYAASSLYRFVILSLSTIDAIFYGPSFSEWPHVWRIDPKPHVPSRYQRSFGYDNQPAPDQNSFNYNLPLNVNTYPFDTPAMYSPMYSNKMVCLSQFILWFHRGILNSWIWTSIQTIILAIVFSPLPSPLTAIDDEEYAMQNKNNMKFGMMSKESESNSLPQEDEQSTSCLSPSARSDQQQKQDLVPEEHNVTRTVSEPPLQEENVSEAFLHCYLIRKMWRKSSTALRYPTSPRKSMNWRANSLQNRK